MRPSSRPLGAADTSALLPRRSLTALALLLAAVLAILSYEFTQGTAALPDLRIGQAFVQDNLWSTDTAEYAVWVAPMVCHGPAGERCGTQALMLRVAS